MNFEIKFLIAQANSTPVLAQAQRRTQQPTPLSSIDLGGLFQQYNNPDGYLTIGALIFLLLKLPLVKCAELPKKWQPLSLP